MPAEHPQNPESQNKKQDRPLWAGSPEPAPYLPLAIDVSSLRCLIVGGGKVASRKTETLLQAGADITVVAPEAREDLKVLARRKKIDWIKGKYRPELLRQCDLVVAATSDSKLNIRIGNDGRRLKKLHCVVSSVPNSQIIFPALYKRGSLTVAVHSNGENCRYSKAIRNRIASLIDDPHPGTSKMVMFGFRTSSPDIGRRTLQSLHKYEKKLFRDNPAQNELLILSTCCRWECYIAGRSARHLSRRVLDGIKKHAGPEIGTALMADVRHLAGHNLYFHLLKTCLGLNSYLIGETEIVSQVRRALNRWVDSESPELYKTFSSALLAAKKIRRSSSLDSARTSWAENTTELIARTAVEPGDGPVLVVGKGKLSGEMIPKLTDSGYKVVSFSRHDAGKGRSENGSLPVLHTDRLGEYIEAASALIICSELTPTAVDALARCNLSGRPVIDLEGYAEMLEESNPKARIYSAADVPQQSISPTDAENIASANYMALRQALIWHSLHNPLRAPDDAVRVGARKSRLSRTQVQEIEGLLGGFAENIQLENVFFHAPCDRDRKTPLTEVKDDDFFTRDLDFAVLSGRIDLAVHSAKDLPERLHPQLSLAATLPTMAPWDCLVSKDNTPLTFLPEGATVATSSLRRRENLACLRPDLRPVDVRGDVPHRLEQLEEGRFDALIVAAVAMIRLGLADRITEIFPEKTFQTTPGQGSLALVVRQSDTELLNFLKPLDIAGGEC